MLQGKRTRRIVAATLLTIMLTNTLAPTVTYALTSGPTQPEATSFEPIDTTDMVNLQTGDFTYNIPLLEVPGPEGGYPLSLSYHAGIQTNEDASWVGLGWTLNPGAITRSVNGFPDDWHHPTNNSHVYWSGGSTTTYNIGISIGLANTPATASFGLSFSQDTYRGFNTGFDVGLGGTLGIKGLFGISAGVGVSYEGGAYAYAGMGLNVGSGSGLNASTSLSVSTNFESLNAGFSGGIGYSMTSDGHNKSMGGSLLGASIKTGSNKPSLSVGGLSGSVSGTTAAGIQTSNKSFGIDIPVWYGVNISLGYSKTRYWIDKATAMTAHGSLYASGWANEAQEKMPDNVGIDAYALLEKPEEKNLVDYPNPATVQGGAFLDFDIYNVNAQGLAGNMRPYLFQGEILGQNRKNEGNNPLITYYSPAVTHGMPQFRFMGDFSNSYRQNYPAYPNPDLNLRLVTPPFDGNPAYGNNDGNYGFSSNKLAGSKHIDVGVTIQPSKVNGYNKNDRYKSYMIDGFSITNESGVTYHYALPAYSWGEETYQEKISRANGTHFNRGSKSEAYAYTWYLTTITGPDFVDRDNDGKAGSYDWGYWINFEYGKWSNNYVWRNPSEGYHRDEDNEWQNCSMGRKEIYYLNAIRTRSHVAYFEKDLRLDGKGASPAVFAKNTPIPDYQHPGKFDGNSSQSLMLRRIYLLNTDDGYAAVNTNDGEPDTYRPVPTRTYNCDDCELAGNVLDRTDMNMSGRSSNLEANALRIIDFNYDYSLCPNTSNSFDINFGSAASRSGKLTLKNLVMRGKRGNGMMPPIKFEYDIPQEDVKTATGSFDGGSFSTTNPVFEIGDMLVATAGVGVAQGYYGVVKDFSVAGGVTTYSLLNNSVLTSNSNITLRTTKNPPYNKNYYDEWGYYKNDFNNYLTFGNNAQDIGNENLGRITGKFAAKSMDAWSLRKIVTQLGAEIKIQYESDSYRKSVLNQNMSVIARFTRFPGVTYASDEYTLFMGDFAATGYKPSYFFSAGDKINLIAFQEAHSNPYQIGSEHPFQRIVDSRQFTDPVTVLEVNDAAPDYGLKIKLSSSFWQYVFNSHSGFYDTYQNELASWATGMNKYFPTSVNIIVANDRELFGGGIRVGRLMMKNTTDNVVNSTIYNYSLPSSQAVSSGVTTFEPSVLDPTKITGTNSIYPGGSFAVFDHTRKAYLRAMYKNLHRLFAISRELPPPAVMYEYVTVTNELKRPGEPNPTQLEGSTRYQFEVFRENMVDRDITNVQQGSNSLGTYYARNVALKKFTGSIGNLKRVTQLDKDGRKLSETINNYLHDGLEELAFSDFMSQYKNRLAQHYYQGYIQERVSEVKEVNNQSNSGDNGVKATLSAREEYPCVQTGQTVVNYVNGTRVSSENIGFDFYSGAVTKTVETDAYGNRFMTEVIPAYRKYSALGLKVNYWANKNMLTQVAGSYLYKVDAANNKLGLSSASVSTWSNSMPVLEANYSDNTIQQNGGMNGDVWRMQSAYSWLPNNKTTDGLTATNNFTDFNWGAPASSHVNWKKTSEIKLYDVYSKGLEATDINGNYAATHMNNYSQRVQLTGSAASYYEIAFAGSEEYDDIFDYGIRMDEAHRIFDATKAHTGDNCFGVYQGYPGISYNISTSKLVAGRDYCVSAWVKPSTGTASDLKLYYQINGVEKGAASSANSNIKAGDWTLVTLVIKGSDITPGNELKVGDFNNHAVFTYVDDMLFRPLNASTTAYVYDQFSGELTYTIDANNLYTKFEYDGGGKLVKIYKEKVGKGSLLTSENIYNYGSVTKYRNTAFSQWITKADCYANGGIGTDVFVTVPEGMFISYESPQDAFGKAYNYAQAEANRRGFCSAPANVYVKIYHNMTSWYFSSCINQYYSTVTLRFYADPLGNTPIKVSNLPVNLNLNYESPDYNTSEPRTEVCSGYSHVITTTLLYDYYDYCQNFSIYQNYTVRPGTGYIFLPD